MADLGTNLREARERLGLTLSDVKAYMGHADIATTMIYVHHVPQVDAAEKLSAALRESATPAMAESRG